MSTCIQLEDGKYTVIHDNGTNFHALRYNKPWRDLTGDGLVLAMAQKIEALLAERDRMREALDEIGGLCRALRQGGPDPMDLEDLSNALEQAVDLSHAALQGEQP